MQKENHPISRCFRAVSSPSLHKGDVQGEKKKTKKTCNSWHGGVSGQPQPSDLCEVGWMRSRTWSETTYHRAEAKPRLAAVLFFSLSLSLRFLFLVLGEIWHNIGGFPLHTGWQIKANCFCVFHSIKRKEPFELVLQRFRCLQLRGATSNPPTPPPRSYTRDRHTDISVIFHAKDSSR